jgi:hypothetical protein
MAKTAAVVITDKKGDGRQHIGGNSGAFSAVLRSGLCGTLQRSCSNSTKDCTQRPRTELLDLAWIDQAIWISMAGLRLLDN